MNTDPDASDTPPGPPQEEGPQAESGGHGHEGHDAPMNIEATDIVPSVELAEALDGPGAPTQLSESEASPGDVALPSETSLSASSDDIASGGHDHNHMMAGGGSLSLTATLNTFPTPGFKQAGNNIGEPPDGKTTQQNPGAPPLNANSKYVVGTAFPCSLTAFGGSLEKSDAECTQIYNEKGRCEFSLGNPTAMQSTLQRVSVPLSLWEQSVDDTSNAICGSEFLPFCCALCPTAC